MSRSRAGFVGRTLRFAVPAGTVAAAATFSAYAILRAEGVTLAEARTTATIVLFAVAFWVLGAVARPLNAARTALLALMAGAFVGVLTIGGLRHFYGLVPPPLLGWVSALIIAMSSVLALESWWRWRHR